MARPKTVKAKPRRAKAKRAAPAPKPPAQPQATFPLELDLGSVEKTLTKVKDELKHWANKGRYTKVRFKFRGKQLLPDLPLAAVVAAEGLTFYWAGILRALIVNVAGQSVIDVELVNDSESRIATGREALLAGDLDRARKLFQEAHAMDRDNPLVHLNLGVVAKLSGDVAGARTALTHARSLDPDGKVGQEAERVLSTLPEAGLQTALQQS